MLWCDGAMIRSRSVTPRLAAVAALLAMSATALLTGCPDKDDSKAPASAPAASAGTNTAAAPGAAGSAKAAEKGGW